MKPLVGAGSPDGGSTAGKEIVGVEARGGEALVDRDQWDRPLILPATGHKAKCEPRAKGGCKCMVGYTRVSTLSETLSDNFGLARWQKGNVVKGLLSRPDLVTAARVVSHNPSALYEIVDLAESVGDNKGAATNGTTFHLLTEMLDRGEELPEGLEPNVLAMLDVYLKTMLRHRFEVTDTEAFVVQDHVKAAGTFDKKMSGLIADVKTGQNLNLMAVKVTMQVATYAASDYYDVGTHERLPLGLTDRNRGVLIWVPWVEDPKDAECEVRWLDLKLGRQMVLHALKTRDYRKLNAEQIMPRIK